MWPRSLIARRKSWQIRTQVRERKEVLRKAYPNRRSPFVPCFVPRPRLTNSSAR